MSQTENDTLKIALAQISPVWLNREKTLAKVCDSIKSAANNQADLIVFGEALVPGYPFWLDATHSSQFENERQKTIHAKYIEQAVQIESGDLDSVCQTAKENNIAIYLGIIERPQDRSGHSLYCSLVYIDKAGVIQSVHRKLMPTYEERLSWSVGDGNGLKVHSLKPFTVGGLNCWENWMPLARASLYAQGEDLHIAVWPGGEHNTRNLTPVIAKESRAYVVSVSSVIKPSQAQIDDLPIPELSNLEKPWIANGGSCVASPDGSWVLEPQVGAEDIFYAEISHQVVRQERQSFDPVGHYSRPDVLQLKVNRERQTCAQFKD